MHTRKLLQTAICAAVLSVGAVTVSPVAWAQNTAPAVEAPREAQKLLSIREVYDLLEKQGYRNFTDIELERRRRRDHEYEVKADNASGDYVKLRVDAYTGRILSERRKRD